MFYKLTLDGVNVFIRHLPHPPDKTGETNPEQSRAAPGPRHPWALRSPRGLWTGTACCRSERKVRMGLSQAVRAVPAQPFWLAGSGNSVVCGAFGLAAC